MSDLPFAFCLLPFPVYAPRRKKNAECPMANAEFQVNQLFAIWHLPFAIEAALFGTATGSGLPGLEVEPEHELDLPRRAGAVAPVQRTGNASERPRRRHCRARSAEVDAIEDVERLEPELEVLRAADGEAFLQREVGLEKAGRADDVALGVAPRAGPGQHERRGIEPLLRGLVGRIQRDARDDIGALARVVAVGQVAHTAARGNDQGTPRPRLQQTGELPS